MSIESRINENDINIKGLSLENPPSEVETFNVERELSGENWQLIQKHLEDGIEKLLNGEESEVIIDLIYSRILVPDKAAALLSKSGLFEKAQEDLEQKIKDNSAEGEWKNKIGTAGFLTLLFPDRRNDVPFKQELEPELEEHLAAIKKKAIEKNEYGDYSMNIFFTRLVYPNHKIEPVDNGLWEKLKQADSDHVKNLSMLQLAFPERIGEINLNKEQLTDLLSEMRKAKQLKEWPEFLEYANAYNILTADHIEVGAEGVKITRPADSLKFSNPSLPETKKF